MTRVKNLPPDWLTERTSVDEVLDRFNCLPLRARTQAVANVTAFASEMQSGDELWRYSSSSESWTKKMASAGLAILRDGVIIDAMQLIMN